MPALPLGDAGPYVAAAFLVFLGLVLVYVAIMAIKLGRLEREIVELSELVSRRDAARAEAEREAVPR
ncbi:MAG: hypothetical protein QOE28_3218 [Solirubrobacteraceae bacterium]|jgi:hypothetical protein|nr:hypothetical protein [Solirubrobacteraceae bacterium]